ncbi:MAG TPA: hypothetical protein PK280_02270 [Planctomycetota bacterium]|nr:hypothetical protein [Planctomycetota bacterium]
MRKNRLILALVLAIPLLALSGERPSGESPGQSPEKPREAPKEEGPVLDLGASDGVFYRVMIYPDLSVKGYTRHNGIKAEPEDVTFSGKISPAALAVILGAIENTGFQKISAELVAAEKEKHYPGKGYFATDCPHTYVVSRVKDREFNVSIYDVVGMRAKYPKVASLEVADRARAAIVNAAKLVMELQSVKVKSERDG